MVPIRYPILASQVTPIKDAVLFTRLNEFHFSLVKYALMGGLMLGSLTELFSQANTVTTTYTTNSTFNVPAGINSVTVECWGGGGAGGGNNSNTKGGGGGGGGGYARSVLNVTPNLSVTVTVGTGGFGSNGPGTSGQNSWFNNTGTVMAIGGQGGIDAQTGGFNGIGGAGTGQVFFSGAPGGNGYNGGAGGGSSNAAGGGGGSSAGTAGNGSPGGSAGAALPGIGGIAPIGGGSGGAGGFTGNTSAAPGFSGVAPGGAGGGAGSGPSFGGNGGNGQVKVTYTQPSAPGTPTAAAGPNINAQENGIFSIVVPGLSTTGAVAGDILTLYQNGVSLVTHGLTGPETTSSYAFTNVTLTGGDGTKSITASVTNAAGNVSASSAALSLTLDTTAPTVSSIAKTTATNSWSVTNGTSASSVQFTVNFSESVTGVDASDFSITSAGSVSGAAITNVSGSGAAWTVTVGSYSGTGTVRLNFLDSDNTVIDAAGNPTGGLGVGNGAFSTGPSYSIVLPEPSSGISSLTVTNQQSTTISVQWNDAVAPATQATHYLVILSVATELAFIIKDGNFFNNDDDPTDGLLVSNVSYESSLPTGTFTFSGLTPATTYYLTLYPYTLSSNNSSDNIDYNMTASATATGNTAPPAPVASAASAVTDNSLNANWAASTAATGYFLDVSVLNTFASFVAGYNNLSVGNVTSFAVNTNLSANTTYYYRVRSTNTNGTSGNSSTITVTTVAVPPVASSATSVNDNSFNANWAASTAATGYSLDVSASGTFASFVTGYNNLSVGNVTSYAVNTNLSANTTYYYRVRATNTNGTSVSSSTISLTTAPASPVASAATSPGQTGFTANWNAITGITDFRLDVSSDDFVTRVAGFDNLAVTGTSKAVTGLNSGITYKYRLRAVSSTGTSSNSNIIGIITVPATPVANTATVVSQTGFTANWNLVTGSDNYLLDISPLSDFSAFFTGYKAKSLLPGNSSEAVSGLTNGTTYYYRVRAMNSSGESPNSNFISQITIPANPAANTVATKSSNSFLANWNAVDGADSYELDVSPYNSVSPFSIFVAGYNAKSVTGGNFEDLVVGLQPQTAYSFRVRAVNAGGKSGNSNIKTMITDASGGGTQQVFTVTLSSFNNGQFSGSTVAVQGQVANGVGVITGTLEYKGITETVTKEKPITVTNGSYSVSVDETMLDELGIEFFVKVRDETDAEIVTTTERIYRAFPSAGSPSIINTSFAGTRASIKIISIPYDLKDNLIESIFSSLGVYDKKGWRLAHFQEGQGNVEYKEGVNRIERGQGYWFNAKSGSVNVTAGEGTVGTYNQTNPFTLSLATGWNQIGNPYPFAIDWSDVLADNSTVSGVGTLKVYNGTKVNYENGVKIEPYTGGFVHADNNVTLNVTVSLKGRANGGRQANAGPGFDLARDSWKLPLTVKQNNSVYDLGSIGMDPSASLSKDPFDEIRLPRLDDYLDITFDHPESRFHYFTQDVIPAAEEGTWKFYVGCNSADANANLEWDNSRFGNNAVTVWLLDVSEVRLVDMKSVGRYSFANSGNKEFRIYYSRNGKEIIPDIVSVGRPYPNPASSAFNLSLLLPERNRLHQVDITLLDMLGKPVKKIFNGETNSGIHTIASDGIDSYGEKLPSGIYLIRSNINDQLQSSHRLVIQN